MHTMKITLALGVLALLASSPARADLFKCKNAHGAIAYSDRPCESSQANPKSGNRLTVANPAMQNPAQFQKMAQAGKAYRCRPAGLGAGSRMKCTEE